MIELLDALPQEARIEVIGVGGGGGIAVGHMIDSDLKGVEFICADTDSQALNHMRAKTLLQMGSAIPNGLGAGGDPEIGRQAALEDRDEIAEVLSGADMVIITVGMGGGTGTGASPIFAEIARELGILTVAVVTCPFPFEGKKRAEIAERGITELSKHVDSLIIIPNQKMLDALGKEASLLEAFSAVNEAMLITVKGIADLIIRPGMINVDFADVRTVMSEMGMATMGTGYAQGENRAREAALAAIRSPLQEDINLHGARGILVNITAGENLSLGEFTEVGDTIEEFASDDATVVVGTVIDSSMEEKIRVTIIATGLQQTRTLSDYSGKQAEEDQRIDGMEALSTKALKLVAPTDMQDEVLVEIIQHLSNVYRSIGGDELVVDRVRYLPPDPHAEISLERILKSRQAR